MDLLAGIGVVSGLIAGVHAVWWLILALLALPRPRHESLETGDESVVVLVPAHNEVLLVGSTVQSLLASARCYRGAVEVCVIADNCSDETAKVAATAGATVFERHDPEHHGKSWALEFALERLRVREARPGIVAFVDADTTVSENFIAAVAAKIRRGADVVQVHYAASPGDEPARRLRRLAFALVHWARPLGASRLGLGTSLKGNGMAYRWSMAGDGLGGYGITEDAAMTLALARRGVRIAFEPLATVTGYMPGDMKAARVQDERWELGRRSLRGPAVRALPGVMYHSPRAAAGVVEVLALPLSTVAFLALGGLAALLTAGHVVVAMLPSLTLMLAVVLSWAGARVSPGDLRCVPQIVHLLARKGALAVPRRRSASGWVRTEKKSTPPGQNAGR